MDNVEETLRSYILSEYLPGESPANLAADTPLRTSGILDSMATLSLVSFVEKTFDVTIEAHETGIESFDCIADIAALVARKKAGA